ncbi:MAG: response regulator transcription factor, partial [Acidimicrobiia bacterium]|nr:response regulator transcription factor [Acidimicrobiia bacterium]MDX2468240.1 response regulator transcription factor [Acidimicrobiia bacterium]
VVVAGSGVDALNAVKRSEPDLIVLDVNLPDLDGFEVCRRLRKDGNEVPVIFLTAREGEDDVRAGFTRGGDDYVKKPFSLEELTLRISALLRRHGKRMAETSEQLRIGGLVLDEDAHRVWLRDKEVEFSPTEFRLLRYLMINAGKVVSKTQILDHVWDYDFDGDGREVEVYISYLRKKLKSDEGAKLIRTVRGFGYSLQADET